MTVNKKLNRRSLFTASAGLAASALAATSVAKLTPVTPANPEGPFYPVHKQSDMDADLTLIEGHSERAKGTVIRVSGQVLDEQGEPVEGALVDIWQANSFGRYHHEKDLNTAPEDPNFQGWAMVKTDAEGRYAFTTIKPGAYPVSDRWSRPPHIHYKVSRRGYHEVTTQMYFAGEALNEADALLGNVAEDERNLLVVDFSDVDGVPSGHFPVVLSRVV